MAYGRETWKLIKRTKNLLRIAGWAMEKVILGAEIDVICMDKG